MQHSRLSQRLQSLAVEHDERPVHHDVDVRVATTRSERRAAGMLVARMYRDAGYLDASHGEAQPFFTPHHSLPQTTVFVAHAEGRIHGTVSVVRDSEHGLPMESLYADELNELRRDGRVPCEVCSLAVSLEHERNSAKLFLQMFRQVTLYILHFSQATDAIVTLKPSHQHFYEHHLGFTRIGGLVRDARFKQADTVAMRINCERTAELYASAGTLKRCQRVLRDVYTPPRREELLRLEAGLLARDLPDSRLSFLDSTVEPVAPAAHLAS
jgi:hypothetical protein